MGSSVFEALTQQAMRSPVGSKGLIYMPGWQAQTARALTMMQEPPSPA